MAFLKSLINRILPGADAGEPREPADHYQRLEYLRRHHELIDVFSPGKSGTGRSDASYQSMILAIDPDNKELLIDELYPAKGVDKLQPGDTLEVSSHSKQATVNFYTRLLARENVDSGTVYRLELPEEVGLNQSRGAYRVYVENEAGLDIDMPFEGESLAAVAIINLSADGIKLSFPQDMSQRFGSRRHFPDCLIRLPDGTGIDCDIELRNLYPINTPYLHSLGGGTLTIKLPQQRVKLQQYLASIQRRQQRMHHREL